MKIKKTHLINIWLLCIFILTGFLQMIIGHAIEVHNGLSHMMFNFWWQYGLESLFYSACHVGLYFWFKNKS